MGRPKKKHLFFLPIAIVLVVIYYFSITVNMSNNTSAKRGIRNYINKSSEDSEVEILSSIELGNKRYVLTELDNRLFLLKMDFKIFNRYRIRAADSYFGSEKVEVVEENKKKYLIYYGKIDNPRITTVVIKIDYKPYKVKLEGNRNVIGYCIVENSLSIGDVIATYDYYDDKGNLINKGSSI
ncbi:hypothetical protein [Clostridium manihotivorum]|uniref:Uncharacterized protein n=1 Tax=Clostridium manihotivorum TaxID=2320868 RepID=A0A3R5QUA9_9CLOT|nr:hypothetical protein [Clostridium manihotivorum]QAA32545.1 hypothetical protein C1I91_13385 [Clostridium manihotivorum]